MSNSVYPTLPGLKFPVKRVPIWKTSVRETSAGREFHLKKMLYPRYKYTLGYEFLRDSAALLEFRTLFGFFNSMGGSFDTFLFNDPDDNSIAGQQIGIGDGTTRTFQLVRTYGGFVDPVYDVNGAITVFVNGFSTTAYVNNGTGGLTFTTAPGAGLPITWTGSFYWRVRFMNDQVDFEKFMYQLWSAGTVEFITWKP